jgi:transcription initiation factor TFIID subunit 1, fungi type
MSLPSSSSLSNQLGISGLSSLNSSQIYNEEWDEDGAVGAGEGEDWEDEVDKELEDEGSEFGSGMVKTEAESPGAFPERKRRTRIVRRLVERPKTVYERFPAFEKGRVLDFTELFKGQTVKKSRLSKRPFQSKRMHVLPMRLLFTHSSRDCLPSQA